MPDDYEDSGPPPTLPPAPKARRTHRRVRPIANAAADAAAANPGAPAGAAPEYRISDDDLEGGIEERKTPKRERQRERQQERQRVRTEADRERSSNPVTRAAVKVSRWPTPGGMLGVGLALVLLLILIIPVNGKRTRLHLLWDALLNLVRLPGVAYPDNDGFGFVDADAAAAAAAGPAGNSETSPAAAPVQPNTGSAMGAGIPLAGGDLGGWGEVGDGFDDIGAFSVSENGRGDPYGAFIE